MKIRMALAALVTVLMGVVMASPSNAAIYGPPNYIKHANDAGYYNTILVATNPDYTGQKALGNGGYANAYSVYVRTGEEIWCNFGNGPVKTLDATGWHDVNLGSSPWQFSDYCDVRKD